VPHRIFVAGGTGYIGSRLIPLLIARGHHVTALVRAGSEEKAKTRCEMYLGNALEGDSFGAQLREYGTFIHLVGVPPEPFQSA